MSMQISGLSQRDLSAYIKMAMNESGARKEHILKAFGTYFTAILGWERLFDIPPATTAELGIEGNHDYPHVDPVRFGKRSVVRGVMGDGARAFVAMKTEILDRTTAKVVKVGIELVHMRRPRPHVHHYVASCCTSDDLMGSESLRSHLFDTGEMSVEQIHAIKNLLDGKTIPSQTCASYDIRLASPEI